MKYKDLLRDLQEMDSEQLDKDVVTLQGINLYRVANINLTNKLVKPMARDCLGDNHPVLLLSFLNLNVDRD